MPWQLASAPRARKTQRIAHAETTPKRAGVGSTRRPLREPQPFGFSGFFSSMDFTVPDFASSFTS